MIFPLILTGLSNAPQEPFRPSTPRSLIAPYRIVDSLGRSLTRNVGRLRDLHDLAKEYRVELLYCKTARVNPTGSV
ncbi:MAG: hypothetical protein II807_02790 [Thermoguttaceae bacterium]|nr:hypothetical protein [Thermoguttaceae bacterium]